jgi:hypothetical protein
MSSEKGSNFFNLNSDDDDEDEEKKAKAAEEMLAKNIAKWDWDREENFNLYYNTNKQPTSSQNNKKSRLLEEEPDAECGSTHQWPIKRTKDVYIESCVPMNSHPCTLFNLYGHHASVNRIHWSKNKNLLLSSSIDRLVGRTKCP